MGKISITIATPHRRDFCPEYILSLVKTLQDGRFDYDFLIKEGSVLHMQRNALSRKFLKGDADYLLFADTDQAWTPQDIELLVNADKDVVSGLIFMKAYPPQIEAIPMSGSLESIPDKPFRLASCGAGFVLIKRRVLETFFSRGTWPYDPLPIHRIFRPDPQIPEIEWDFPSNYFWEDLSFSIKARQLGFSIWCEPRARIGHIGPQVFMQTPDLAKWFEVVGRSGYSDFRGKGL